MSSLLHIFVLLIYTHFLNLKLFFCVFNGICGEFWSGIFDQFPFFPCDQIGFLWRTFYNNNALNNELVIQLLAFVDLFLYS